MVEIAWPISLSFCVHFQVKEMILTGVRKLGLLLKAASTGNIAIWKTVVAAVERAEHLLLKEVQWRSALVNISRQNRGM